MNIISSDSNEHFHKKYTNSCARMCVEVPELYFLSCRSSVVSSACVCARLASCPCDLRAHRDDNLCGNNNNSRCSCFFFFVHVFYACCRLTACAYNIYYYYNTVWHIFTIMWCNNMYTEVLTCCKECEAFKTANFGELKGEKKITRENILH